MAKKKPRLIPFYRPSISKASIREVVSVMKSGWLTTGPMVKQFEDKFAKTMKARYALAVNSGTAALHLALDAIGLEAGDEVVLPTNTFAATAEVVEYFNARPRLCDVRRDTQNLDESLVEKLINKKTRAIIPVHYGGYPCEMDTILKIARKHRLKVIEDAAHCTPAYYKGRPVGSLGDITCFSFYANKCITTGEGGMVLTDNRKYYERMKVMSLHGLSRDAWNRYSQKGNWYYEIVDRGFKYNMTDVAAALGIHQLREVHTLWKKRKNAARRYYQYLKDIPEIRIPQELKGIQSSWYIYPIRVNHGKVNRNQFVRYLDRQGIKTSVHFIPLHLHPFYRKKYRYKRNDFKIALDNYMGCITLPFFPSISKEDQQYVAQKIKYYIEKCTE